MAPKRARKVKGLLNSEENVYNAEYIVAQRQSRETGDIEYCVKWMGYPHYHNTWEPAANIIDPRLLVEFLSGSRLTEGSIVELDTTSTEGNRDTNNKTNTSGQQDSTVAEQVPKPLKGILKKRTTGSSGLGGGGRKRKVADRKGDDQGGAQQKKGKNGAAQPKKKEEKDEDEGATSMAYKFFPNLLGK